MSGNIPMLLPKTVQQGIIEFSRQCYNLTNMTWNIREQMQAIDRLYQRELDFTQEQKRAAVANKYGDPTKFQNITVPVVLPAVEAAVTYQTSVFLTGYPLFESVAAPAYADEALQMNTVIADQAQRTSWVRELMLFFRDGFKFNLSALECDWGREITAAFETDLTFSTKEAKPVQTVWEGNRLKRLDLYNTIFDSRCFPSEIHKKGEFVGYTELYSRVALKQLISEMPPGMATNLREAFESGLGFTGTSAAGMQSYFMPQINPDAVLRQDLRMNTTNWMAWAGLSERDSQGIQYKDVYQVTKLYGRIIPSDFGLNVPAKNTPQIWKFIIVNHSVIIYAERQTNAHGYLPILFSQPLEDGLGYQTKSLAQNIAPIQSITSALANSSIASRRRAISDRVLYDPSRIDKAQINSDNPSAKIPVRPAAYGKNIAESVYAFPFRDDQAPIATQEIQQYLAMSNNITGQNQVRQGQFVKGNKTQREFDTVMGNANGRDQMCAILLEAQLFTPLKTIIKSNILQYQGGVSLYNATAKNTVKIDPVALRTAIMNFKISDGLTPADKIVNSDTLSVAMQQIGSSPAIAQGYNIAPMFSYLMKTQNLDLSPFQKSQPQVAYEQAVGQWQQASANIAELMKAATMKIEGITLQDLQTMVQKMLPPQPKPQDFGYDPNSQNPQPAGTQQSSVPGNSTGASPQTSIPQMPQQVGEAA